MNNYAVNLPICPNCGNTKHVIKNEARASKMTDWLLCSHCQVTWNSSSADIANTIDLADLESIKIPLIRPNFTKTILDRFE